MMYIRTDCGIYEVNDENFDYVGKEYRSETVLSQSTILEELCDGYIIDNPNLAQPFYIERRNWPILGRHMLEYGQQCHKTNVVVYGAIWTKNEHGEPILKPVAKMNEKGALKLL